MNPKRTVGIMLFPDAEVLDFAGPFEVFSVCAELHNFQHFEVFTIAEQLAPIKAVNGLSINPTYDFSKASPIDILIIPGGVGVRKQLDNKVLLNWIEQQHQQTEYTLSICSGALLLGKLGLLDGEPYCTHHEVYADMEKLVPTGKPQQGKRFAVSGKLFTSGGISAGIDLSFHLVEKLLGKKAAEKTARYMEYRREG